MPDPQHEHGSGVVPVNDYAPGSRAKNPSGLSQGVRALPAEPAYAPAPPRPKRSPRTPGRPGRRLGGKNRPEPTEEMFDDGPPDAT